MLEGIMGCKTVKSPVFSREFIADSSARIA
jgi:hypothetical protein